MSGDVVREKTERIFEVGCAGKRSAGVHADEEREARLLFLAGGATTQREKQESNEQESQRKCHRSYPRNALPDSWAREILTSSPVSTKARRSLKGSLKRNCPVNRTMKKFTAAASTWRGGRTYASRSSFPVL